MNNSLELMALVSRILSALNLALEPLRHALISIGDLLFSWVKPEAETQLLLNELATLLTAAIANRMRRAKSFFQRALKHKEFNGEQFANGNSPILQV